jgi:hypothetical protein
MGMLPVRDVHNAFRNSLTVVEAPLWPKSKFEAALATSIRLIGRRDQPKKMLSGYQWPEVFDAFAKQEAEKREAERQVREKEEKELEARVREKAAKVAKVRAELDRIKAEHAEAHSFVQGLNTKVAKRKELIFAHFEYAPGETVSYDEIAHRFEELFPVDSSAEGYRAFTTSDVEAILKWYCWGRFAGGRDFLDHRWCPLMRFPDGRLKENYDVMDDGNRLPKQTPGYEEWQWESDPAYRKSESLWLKYDRREKPPRWYEDEPPKIGDD